ncbi:MAG: hydrogenase subunit MbhD domain-containing protein [Gammaproteobacteria bacterium]|nr:hydrogenase subunit MbhD domain-containing protein [Gammaproteobacteria bacterium]
MLVAVFGLFLLSLLVITAIAIVRSEDLFSAVMLSSIFSLLMAANFFVLDAADVALTEAAVGAGVATVLLLGALALTPTRERPGAGTVLAGHRHGGRQRRNHSLCHFERAEPG